MIPAAATRTPPTKPGWYWHFDVNHEKFEPRILKLEHSENSCEGPSGLCAFSVGYHGAHLIRDDPTLNLYDGWWLEVAPPEARWFKPMPEEAASTLPDPLF